MKTLFIKTIYLFSILTSICLIPVVASAHCDTLAGPVVLTAKAALEKGDVTPVLKWVKKEDENEIKELFNKTLIVRKQGKEARELADMYFFETLVRIHRTGEGAPYTGLKPGEAVEPSVAEADKALEIGKADNLIKMINDAVAKGIHEHFEHAKETKQHSDESVEAGRKFVEAYVEFTHYIERIHMDASSGAAHNEETRKAETEEHQHHH